MKSRLDEPFILTSPFNRQSTNSRLDQLERQGLTNSTNLNSLIQILKQQFSTFFSGSESALAMISAQISMMHGLIKALPM
jgi:hypothetical protein